jgi:hypothetical protein
MSVIKMGLRPGRNASFGKVTENKSKLVWLAVTDNNDDDENIVGLHGWSNSILPVPFVHAHPLYSTQLCRNISFSQDSSAPRKWDIEAEYSSEPLKTADQTNIAKPTDRPAKIKWKSQQYRKAIDKDINGHAIVNSAGDYFDPPPEIDSSHWVATIEKNVPAVPTFILSYTDAINSDSFTIQGMTVSQHVAKIMDLDISDLQTEGDFGFYVFTYSLEFRPETWKYKPLDQGFRTIEFGGLRQILDDATPPRPVTTPRLLDGNGRSLDNPSPSTAQFLEYDVYNAYDFGGTLPGLGEVED